MREAITRGFSLMLLVTGSKALSFTTQTDQLFRWSPPAVLTMRDAFSAYWFNAEDSVRVVDDVMEAGANLNGRTGTVVQTWEKCDVDPTCCCAEQVDLGMAVHVEFQGDDDKESFLHFFAEEELVIEKEYPVPTETSNSNNEEVPFDGMSCKAFKAAHANGRTSETNRCL
jgi:hypothetical protein